MTVLETNAAKLSPAAHALFEQIAAKRKARGEGFGGPYVALFNHPELARRIEELGFFLKFEGVLPRPAYQFIVLSVARACSKAIRKGFCSMISRMAPAATASLSRTRSSAIGPGTSGAISTTSVVT